LEEKAMSKYFKETVLVLPAMPKRCADCSLQCSVAGMDTICIPTMKAISDEEYYNKKPDWCLLFELPEEKPSEHTDSYNDGWCEGYNSCVNDIKETG
jgi:hypothetical protein